MILRIRFLRDFGRLNWLSRIVRNEACGIVQKSKNDKLNSKKSGMIEYFLEEDFLLLITQTGRYNLMRVHFRNSELLETNFNPYNYKNKIPICI